MNNTLPPTTIPTHSHQIPTTLPNTANATTALQATQDLSAETIIGITCLIVAVLMPIIFGLAKQFMRHYRGKVETTLKFCSIYINKQCVGGNNGTESRDEGNDQV
jgi:hypothetical protein